MWVKQMRYVRNVVSTDQLSLPATLETGVTLCMYIPTIYSETGTEYIFFPQFSYTYKLNIP